MPDFPITKRNDVSPEKWTTQKKEKGESFNQAMNKPNTPTMKRAPDMPYNVTDAYCQDGDE